MPVFYGSDVTVTAKFTTAAGAPVDPSSVVCTVTDPTGNVTTPTATSTVVGTWTATVPAASVAGIWKVRFVGSGTFNATYEDEFIVRPLSTPGIVDLGSVKTQLGIPSSDTSQDGELEGYIEAATELIRDIIGPVFPETHTQTFSGGRQSISVDWKPIQSVTSVTEKSGTVLFTLTEQPLSAQTSNFGFTVDYDTGQITRRTFSGGAAQFAPGYKNITVTYVAGLGSVPFAVRLASLRLIQHWFNQFKSQRGPRRGMNSALDVETPTPMGFAVPDAVVEMLAPWRRPPGVA